jgi:septal ring factor EnvC (AmiA/AmiB activator)
MTWFPGRQALQAELTELRAELVRARASADEGRRLLALLVEQNRDLVAQLAAMKRDGFDSPPPAPVQPPMPQFPDQVQVAIRQRAEPRSREWALLERTAAELLAKGEAEDAVALSILEGEDPDDL